MKGMKGMNKFDEVRIGVDVLTAVWSVCYKMVNGAQISIRVCDSDKGNIERAVMLSRGMRMGYFESRLFDIDVENADGSFYSPCDTVVVNIENVIFYEMLADHYTRDENGDVEFNGIRYTKDEDNEGEDK